MIEHVENPELFLNEMLRVAKRIYLTTPNKFFPVEAHTNLLFLHWSDRLFASWKRAKQHPTRIDLLSFGKLQRLLRRSIATEFEIIRNKMFGLTMTFTVVAAREPPLR